jgi:L-alanine-DL-glutamate epimerase-like enolase superfamily enzyme
VIITDVECIILRLPEVKPIGDGCQDAFIVRVHTDEGITGIGEGKSSPWILKAIVEAPLSTVSSRGLKEIVVGRDPLQIRPLWDEMYKLTYNYGRRGALMHALSAIDMALWDILGKTTGQPVWRLLGGAYRQEVPAYASTLAPEKPEDAVEQAKRFVQQGFRAMKFGWGSLGGKLRVDLELVERVRRAAGDDVDIMFDAGMPMPLHHAIAFSRGLRDYDVYFLEEPLSPDDLDGFRELREAGGVQIATGEKETSRFAFRDLIERGRPHIIQPDLARVGGITEAQRIGDFARLHGVTVIPHFWSTDILLAANLHYIASLQDCPYAEFCVLDQPLRRSVTTEPIELVDGMVRIPDKPGLGVELNQETVERFGWSL